MEYTTVLLDNCINLRPNTINALKAFANAGGKIVISGRCPEMSLAKPSNDAKELVSFAKCVVGHSKTAILGALAEDRDVIIRNSDNALTKDVLYTRRTEGDTDWLFICNAFKPELLHVPNKKSLKITVKGLYRPTLYNTVNGKKESLSFEAKNGETVIYYDVFDFDSLLIRLDKCDEEISAIKPQRKIEKTEISAPSVASFTLSEPNVLLLDMPEWHLEGEEYRPKEEIMRIDEIARKQLGLPLKRTKCVQPYAVAAEPDVDRIYLKFTFNSEIAYDGAALALENLVNSTVSFNGTAVDTAPIGYFVDKEIKTCALPAIVKGENTLEISMPFGVRTDVENCFVLGAFGTGYKGREVFITSMPEKLAFGDAVHQGLAFYGANITYETEVELDEASEVEIEVSYYRGALVKVEIDGNMLGYIWKSPFRLPAELAAGKHKIEYTVFGNRYNTFAALHTLLADKKDVYTGPDYWRSAGFGWAYEYNTKPMGILKAPVVKKIKEI